MNAHQTAWHARLILIVCMVVFAGSLSARAASQATSQSIELINAVQQAAKTLNYKGTFAHQRNGEMNSFRVVHRFDQGTEQERVEVLDDSPREYLRVNDRVQCLLPEHKLVVIETQRQERFPALLMSKLDEIGRYYDLSVSSKPQRVAGRSCLNVSIKPKDSHRPHYELCVDQKTGLLLEAQMLDSAGHVLEHMAFTQVDIGGAIEDSALKSEWPTDQWRVVQRTYVPVDLKAQGWFYQMPPGYRPVMQVRQTFAGGREVSQVILTDGLATLSIFIEPYQQNLSQQVLDGASRSGAVNLFGKRLGSFWVVVAGEASAQTVRHLAESVVRTGPLHNR